MDPDKARLIELGFKKNTEGLTPAEEAEMEAIRQRLKSANSSIPQ